MGTPALVTAGVAAVLLVVTLGADVAMTTTYTLEVWNGSAWRELAREPRDTQEYSRAYSVVVVPTNASDDLRFRLRADNGYLWSQAHEYQVTQAGIEVAQGTLATPQRATSEVEFTVPASQFFGSPSAEPRRAGEAVHFADIQVSVGGEFLYASFQIREVSR